MLSFKEFLLESDKFNSAIEVENYTYGKSSPKTFKDAKAIYDRLSLPEEFVGLSPIKGQLDTLILNDENDKYQVEFDFPRKLMKVFEIGDELDKGTLYKSIPLQDLVKSK